MSKSISARDIKVSIIFNLFLASVIILLCFFLFFLVIFNNFLTTPVVTVNITVEDAPAIPTGIPKPLHVAQYLKCQTMQIV